MNQANTQYFMANKQFWPLSIKAVRLFLAPAFIALFMLCACQAQVLHSHAKVTIDQSKFPFHHLPYTLASLNDSTIGIVPDGRRLVLYNSQTGKIIDNKTVDTQIVSSVFLALKDENTIPANQQLLTSDYARNIGTRPFEVVSLYRRAPDTLGMIASLLSVIEHDSNGTTYAAVQRDFFELIYPLDIRKATSAFLLSSDIYNPVANFEVLYIRGKLCMPHIRGNPLDTLDQIVCFGPGNKNMRQVNSHFLKVDSIAAQFSAKRKLQRYTFSTFKDEILVGTDQCVYLSNGNKEFCLADYSIPGCITRLHKNKDEKIYFFVDQKDTCRLYSLKKNEARPKLLRSWPYPGIAVFLNNEITVLTKESDAYYFQTFPLNQLN